MLTAVLIIFYGVLQTEKLTLEKLTLEIQIHAENYTGQPIS